MGFEDPWQKKCGRGSRPQPGTRGGVGALPGFAGLPGSFSDVKHAPEKRGRVPPRYPWMGVWLIDKRGESDGWQALR